jgi:hypothetical protein
MVVWDTSGNAKRRPEKKLQNKSWVDNEKGIPGGT